MAHEDKRQRAFTHFAEICDGRSPLYAQLARAVADDESLLALGDGHTPRQPVSNLLFGGVQDLLLSGVQHELRDFYPSVGGRRGPEGAVAAFTDFCASYAPKIKEYVITRRVQTNEVNRCGALLPAFGAAYERFGRRPLALIDVGASAGLNLSFDRFRYVYTVGGADGPIVGGDSPVIVRTALLGASCPVPAEVPPVAMRTGVDVAPVDIDDAAAVRWIQSLIWADQVERHERFRAAVDIARAESSRVIVRGDAMELLPALIDQAPRDAVVCVYHSHAIYQMDSTWRAAFESVIADASVARDVAHVSLEWLGDDPGPRLHLTECRAGVRRTTWLAECHHHGEWINWQPPRS